MSIESAKKFLERLNTDEDFAKKVTAFKDADARMKFVKSEGFDFTAEEISSLKRELSDEELDSVAGGAWICEGDSICGKH